MRLVSILIFALSLRAADPILQQHFTNGTEGWIVTGNGELSAAAGVLTLRYEAAIAALPAKTIPLSEMKSMRFELKTDVPFAVAAGLGAARAVVWSRGDIWQPVVLAPGDFSGNARNADAITFSDFTQYLLAVDHDPRVYSGSHKGTHAISIRGFEILRDPPETNSRPQVEWFSLGGAELRKTDGLLSVRYQLMPDLWTAITRLVSWPDGAGASRLALDIQSQRDAQLAISIRDGNARHTVDFFVPAGTKPEHREVLLDAFQPKGLDASTARSITILDITGGSAPNEIKLGPIRIVPR